LIDPRLSPIETTVFSEAYFAVQLGHRAGVYVIALGGLAARGVGLREFGADEVVIDLGDVRSKVTA
jgi:hypothetical protein